MICRQLFTRLRQIRTASSGKSSLDTFIQTDCQMGTDALEHLHQQDKNDNRKQHDQIFVTVVAVVDGNFTESAAADDTAHGRVAQNGGNGNGSVGN